MWVVADLDDDYIAKMEDVLETYEQPYDPRQPVVCLDEKPVTLHADVRPPSPAQPGREARRDNEYERCGTANIFWRGAESGSSLHVRDAGSFRLRIRPGSGQTSHGIPVSYHHPSGHRQSQQPYPEVAGSGLRSRNGGRSLEPLHSPLHPHPRQLAQSS